MLTSRVACVLVFAAFAAGAAGTAGPAAAAASKSCPPRFGSIVNDHHGFGRVWHRGNSLYACTTVYGHAPKAKRMGPWTPSTKVAFDGVELAWTVRMTIAGKRSDRIWAANVDSARHWMVAQKPNPAGATLGARETLVRRLVVVDQSAAWVTKGGDVVGALVDPADTPVPTGQPAPSPVQQKHLVTIGSWPDAVAAVTSSLTVKELPGEGDECGGGNPYAFTVVPDPQAGPVGVTWDGYWTSTGCA